MNLLALSLCILLAAVACLHLLWALGSTFPRASEAELARTVVGQRGAETMPPRWASLLVALCLLAAAVWALAMRPRMLPVELPQLLRLLGGGALALVFGARGILGVLPAFERLAPEQPFLKLNRYVYSPLCVLIAIGFGLLVLALPNWGWRLGG